MDGETRAYLEDLRREFVAMRDSFNTRFEGLESKIDTLDRKIDTLDGKVDTLDRRVDTLDRKVDTLDRRVDTEAERTRRHFDVTAEALGGEIRLVAEGVRLNTEAITRLGADMDARFRASEAVTRAAFTAVHRDIAELRAGR